jgi:hypothetical protein
MTSAEIVRLVIATLGGAAMGLGGSAWRAQLI